MANNIAIIGAGVWAQNHLTGWRAQPEANITWVVRSTDAAARETAARWGVANASADWRAVVARDDIDIVDILLPHDMHADVACAALGHGKHVVLEKPLAVTLKDAHRIAAAARASGRKVMVSENWIYSTLVQKAKAVIDAGEIGTPYLIRTTMDMDVRGGFKGLHWRHDAARMGGGALMDGGTHCISAARYLLGEVREVAAFTASNVFDAIAPMEDTAQVLMRFESGAMGTVSVAWGAQVERPRTGIVIMGPKGTIEFDTHVRNFYLSRNQQKTEQFDMQASRGFVEQMRHFMECLADDQTPITSPDEQIGSLKVVLGAYRSAATGQLIRMTDLID